jgi:hypothetical protein
MPALKFTRTRPKLQARGPSFGLQGGWDGRRSRVAVCALHKARLPTPCIPVPSMSVVRATPPSSPPIIAGPGQLRAAAAGPVLVHHPGPTP